jgi:hypothetical protein
MDSKIRQLKTSGARRTAAKADLSARDGRRVKGGLLTTFIADLQQAAGDGQIRRSSPGGRTDVIKAMGNVPKP